MKLIRARLLIFFSAFVYAQRSSASDLSKCALACVAQTVPVAGCSLDDAACQCKSKPLSLLLSGCMVANCTMQESLVLSRAQAVTCGLPFEDKSKLMVGLFTAVIAFTSVLVVLRLASKLFIKKQLGVEDYFAALAQCLSIVSNTFAIRMAELGFGKHLYSLKDGALKIIFLRFYVGENIYVAVLGLIKISILAFYLRIFQHEARFRIAVYATIIFIAIGTTTISVLTICQCHPVPYFWDKDLPGGTCVNINALAYSNSGLSIVQDFLIIVLPIRVVWMMNLDRKRKWSVAFMFGLGGFGCVISIIRLQSLLIFGTSIDPSWDYVPVTIWTVVELAVAIICSCLPALRALVIYIYPRLSITRSSLTPSRPRNNSDEDGTMDSSLHSRTRLTGRERRRGRRDSTAVSVSEYLIDDVHIECGRLDIKWEEMQVEVKHVEDAPSDLGLGQGKGEGDVEGSSATRKRGSWI